MDNIRRHKTIGILGGMGPAATVELFRLIVEHTQSETDQGHIRILIDNNPQIPDRTCAILSGGESPVPPMVRSALGLKSMGADFLIMPCNTSHYFLRELQERSGMDFVDMIEETVSEAQRAKCARVGILATTGTLRTNLYSDCLHRHGMTPIAPSEAEQLEIMSFIYSEIKSGKRPYDTASVRKISERLYDRGADTIILGCTELSVAIRECHFCNRYLDSLLILAKASIGKAGFCIKREAF